MELLESVKKATLSVLKQTTEDELKVITLPILRAKVANVMEIAIEEFLGKDIKLAIMETFQDFLLKVNEEAEKKESEAEEKPKELPVKPLVKKRHVPKQETVNATPLDSQPEKIKSSHKSTPKKTESPVKAVQASAKSAQIEKLKSYVFKCGVRKVWKKEFDGLNESQCIAKLQGILRELGIEGKPSLEQCKAIKERREFEAELREIDTSNIIEGKRRRSGDTSMKRKLVIEESEDENEQSDEEENAITIDLKALGDSESESN